MPEYLFKCDDCSLSKSLNISISEFLHLNDNLIDNSECKGSCLYKNKRVFKDISSKIERDQNDRIVELKEESRKIVSKVKQGDLKTIENIYGT
tara:strand:+ start:831 stop:1109 length:279 start_codon:yes stop_codon:yes gene_type:complete